MGRATRALIDLSALKHNYRLAKQLAPQSRALAAIKANAYGHGAVAVAQALSDEADAFGVACVEEALALRGAGISNPILLLEGFFKPSELELLVEHQLDTVIHCTEQLECLLSTPLRTPVKVWLKMDSGMHRLGFSPETFTAAYRVLQEAPQVSDIMLMSHFARADELDSPYTQQQIDCFNRWTQGLQAPRSLANSSAVLAWPDSHAQWVRPGMMLYGVSPLVHATSASALLRPVMQLESEIIAIRALQAGESIGYGGRYICDKPTLVGVVAIGYGDGYPRHARDGTPVLVNGQRTELIGRVSMDMLTVDLSDIAQVRIGDPVQLWGADLSANEVAAACDTIAYELVTGISPRVPLLYLNQT
jgi:alanine racemase